MAHLAKPSWSMRCPWPPCVFPCTLSVVKLVVTTKGGACMLCQELAYVLTGH